MSEQRKDTRRKRDGFLNTWYYKLFLAITIIAVLILTIRIVLNPVALYFTRESLGELQGYTGTVKDVSVSVVPPRFEIADIKLAEDPGKPNEFLFSAERIRLSLVENMLLKGTLVANVTLDYPKVVFVQEKVAPPEVKEEKKPPEIPDVEKELKQVPPLRINQVVMNEGEIVFVDATEETRPQLWVHDMKVEVNNVATREKLARDTPTTVTATAVIQRSGRMKFFMTVNPWEKGLTFSGELELKGLALPDLKDFFTAQAELQPVRGTFSLFVTFQVRENKITGGIKPILENVDVAPEDPSFVNWLKSKFIDATISLLSGTPEAPEEEKIATVIPIKGTIQDPNPQILPTVLGIIRNAFVEGLAAGFTNLPPPTAPEKEGVMEQIFDAITPEGGPPKAQPEEDE
ncbi:MAG: DUF748 domain-containing protein [wastewater metagenome]|nr:DUF748 domain-containing protein [Candidatus Loosdrechtia aerotolerans]